MASRRRRVSELTLRENANQRTARWRLRAKVANESILGPDFHMTGCTLGAIDQHRSYRRFIWIQDRQFLESVIVHQLLAGLFRKGCLRPRFHYAGGNQRFLNEMPALGKRVRTCAFLGNGSGSAQSWINLRIGFGKRLNDLFRIILFYNLDRLLFAGGIGVIKLWSR